jgi:mercuric ion binding protein
MTKTVFIVLALLVTAGSGVAYAVGGETQNHPAAAAVAQRQTTFAIENMTCATCPITVRTAMRHVAGVAAVQVDFAAKTARVTYDSRRANVAQIAAASTNAGYPAHILAR